MTEDPIPRLALSCAITRDGYLDDKTPTRRMISSGSDLAAMMEYRTKFDMIVIGAETMRRDNPNLSTRDDRHFTLREMQGRAPHPDKMVVTRSNDIPRDTLFFQTGNGEKIILHNPRDLATAILDAARIRGHQDVLVEGGAAIISQILASGCAAEWRLAVSDIELGVEGGARLEPSHTLLARYPSSHIETFDETTTYILNLKEARLNTLMERAFELSRNCPPSDTAFAVGAIACDANLQVLSTGYSRETGPKDHAEEAMLSKLNGVSPHTVICTLEPCLHRSSKSTGCAAHLVAAGVKRVIYAVAEDRTFTQQSGLAHLRAHGVELRHLRGFNAAFRAANGSVYTAETDPISEI